MREANSHTRGQRARLLLMLNLGQGRPDSVAPLGRRGDIARDLFARVVAPARMDARAKAA